jgi:hypothetical protein
VNWSLRNRLPTARVESTAAVKTTIPLVWLVFVGVVLSAPMRSAEAEESRRQPGAFAAVQYEMPERLRRQVAPAPSTPWSPPDLQGYTRVLKSAEPLTIVDLNGSRPDGAAAPRAESQSRIRSRIRRA